MGCAPSVVTNNNVPSSSSSSKSPSALAFSNLGSMGGFASPMKHRRSTTSTMASVMEGGFERRRMIPQREGSPSQYGEDGYDIGLRVRVKGAYQSFFVGCARDSGEKVTVKEHHLRSYTVSKQHNHALAHSHAHTRHRAGEEKDAAMAVAMHEVTILSRLSHPTVPHLQEVFVSAESVYMVMDYLDSYRLWHFIDWRAETSQLSVEDSRFILRSIGQALLHCHQQGVIVRDLSPMNILVKKNNTNQSNNNNASQTNQNQNQKQQKYQCSSESVQPFEVKIVDFSLAVLADGDHSTGCALSEHVLFDWSLVPFLAPEALLGGEEGAQVTKASDVWSLGVLGFLMLTGRMPFEGYEHNSTTDDHFLLDNIRGAQYAFDDNLWVEKAAEVGGAQQLISQVLRVSQPQRLTMPEVMKHSWLQIAGSSKK